MTMTSKIRGFRRKAGRGGVTACLVLALALFTAGCSTETSFWSPAATPKANQVSLVHLTHDVLYQPGKVEMDSATVNDLNAFLARHDIGYGDRVYVVASSGQPDPLSTRRADDLSHHLGRLGLGAAVLSSAEWAGAPESHDALRVLVHRFVVASPKCPDWRKPAQTDYGNTVASNFGCATAVNLGLMVADPRDLIEGRDEGDADGTREAAAIKRYRDGKVTPLEAAGAVSK